MGAIFGAMIINQEKIMKHKELTSKIIGVAFRVHRELGPGLLKSVYETCLAHELSEQGLDVARDISIPIVYGGLQLNDGFSANMMVNQLILVEVRSVPELESFDVSQMVTYLKLSNKEVGILINFNVENLRSGIKRVVNWHYRPNGSPGYQVKSLVNMDDQEEMVLAMVREVE